MLALCKTESTELLVRECESASLRPEIICPGLVGLDCRSPAGPLDLCYAFAVMLDEEAVADGGTISAGAFVEHFLGRARELRFDSKWPLQMWDARSGVMMRASRLETSVRDRMKPVMARVARLADFSDPPAGVARGFVTVQSGTGAVWAATHCWFGGQARMRDDPEAPSRSYLKAEEAFRVFGREPSTGESVADLGAAPGGWSYSAARRGAHVIAVDNGPLKGAAAAHPSIRHVRDDAFVFRPQPGSTFDWLLCDMVENPARILPQVEKWLENKWCRRFVVNLKTGRMDGPAMVHSLLSAPNPIRRACRHLILRELFHDREEITMMGEL